MSVPADSEELGGENQQASGAWLERHTIELDDGHKVGVWVGGSGVPLVMVSGFTALPGFYVQTLARVAELGFRVIAIDPPGHGLTDGVPLRTGDMAAHADVISRAIQHLGVERSVLMGHSMGGRLVTHVAADLAESVLGLVLIDPIVGAAWDRLLRTARFTPPLLAAVTASLLVDSVAPGPMIRQPRQALTLARLALPTVAGHVVRPWRLASPTLAILRAGRSAAMLNIIAEADIPVTVIHGEKDLIVPLQAGRDAAKRTNGSLVVVRGGLHSWLLMDPGSLPLILSGAGGAVDQVADALGLDADVGQRWNRLEAEQMCLADDALVLELAGQRGDRRVEPHIERRPRHDWVTESFGG